MAAKSVTRKPGVRKAASNEAGPRDQPLPISPRLVPLLIVGLSFLGIFLAPYYFPVSGPNGSQSWEFGFSNTAAQGFIALMLLALFAWKLFFEKSPDQALVRVLTTDEREDHSSIRSLLFTMGILQLMMVVILLTWYQLLPYSHYGEFTYFVQRVEEVILNRVPYRDFAFDYGPGMLAVPVFIYRIFNGAVSVETAYVVTLILHYVVGFALLAYVVTRVRLRGYVTLVFALLALPFINLTMGLNYTPLRFTFALAAIFGIRHLYLFTQDKPRSRWLLLSLAGFLAPILTFAVSPEMGLALTIGLLVYFGWFIFGAERRFALLLLPAIAGVGAAVLLFPRAYFDSILSFGKGGASFPIFPTVHILGFLVAAIWVLPRLGVIAIRSEPGVAPWAAGLAVFFGLLILPATGRCDSGHVYFNSLGLFVLGLAAATWAAPGWRYTLLVLFGVIYPLIDQVTFWDHYRQPIQGALAVRDQLSGFRFPSDDFENLPPGSPRPRIHYSKLLPMPQWFNELPKVPIGLPVGADENLERYLVLTGRNIPEYHIAPFGDIFDPGQLPSKFADLATMDYIFIPQYYLNYLRVNPAAQMQAQGQADCVFMSSLLLFPISLTPVHQLFQSEFDIMHRIATEYGLVKQYPGGLLLKRKG